jgi:LacI family transcriptional regulator
MATIHDVARRAGVASITVSRALTGHAPVSAATRARIEAAIRELKYVPNVLARGLKGRSTRTLGLVVTDVTNPFFTLVARGVEDAAHEAGYSVILCNSDRSAAREALYLEVLHSKQVDGLVLTPIGRRELILQWHRERPVCLIDRTLRGLGWRKVGMDLVRADSVEGARALVDHLLGHGHRRIGLVNGPLVISTARDRREGYRRALAAAGVAADRALERHGLFSFPVGEEMGADLLAARPRPTAIFAGNPLLAIGVMAAAQKHGLHVPDDLALATFDGVPQLEAVLPFFTAAVQPAYQMGQRAARQLLERLAWRAKGEDPPGRETLFETDLMIRRSCGCALSEGLAVGEVSAAAR